MKIIFIGIPRLFMFSRCLNLPADQATVDYGYVDGVAYTIVDTGSHPCAYIGLPDTHPFASMTDEMIPLEVHGGITYKSYSNRFPYPDLMWIGWDYAHYGDYTGYSNELGNTGSDEVKHTFKMVLADVMDTIKQIKEYKNGQN